MLRTRTWFDVSARARLVLGLVLATAIGAPPAWGADALGEKVLLAGRDPSFESVSSYFPAMKRPWEAVGVKAHRDEFVVMPDGRVNFSPQRVPKRSPFHWGQFRQGLAFFSLSHADHWLGKVDLSNRYVDFLLETHAKKRLMDGNLPIVIVNFTPIPQNQPRPRFEQTVVAWSQAMSADARLWAFIRLRAFNPDDRKRDVRLAWYVDHGTGKDRKVRRVASWTLKLAPGAEQSVYVKLPFLDGLEKATECSAAEFESRLKEARAFWSTLLDKGMRIGVPEQRVNDAYRAWRAFTFLNVDKIDGVYEPHDGCGFYERVYGIMAAKYCDALGLLGYTDEAREYLDSLCTLISPEGSFRTGFGAVDTGSLLLAMANHYRLTGNAQWLRDAAPKMIKLCDFIIKKRKETWTGQKQDALCYGLVASNVGVDNKGTEYNFVTDTYLCRGMEATAEVLAAVGMTDDAARIGKETVAYRRDIERSMTRAVVEHDGMKMLPIVPETHKFLKRRLYVVHGQAAPGQGYSGHGYYSLFGSVVLETGFLPASDARFRLIPELLERRNGLLMGMCAFGTEGGIDHAFTYGYWMNCLERGEVDRVLLGFYGSLAYGMTRETFSSVECTHMFSGYNQWTMPHLRSGTQQLRLLRNMLVREQAGRLLLAQAVPQHWLIDGKRVEVLDAPTHFGKVSYTIDSHVEDGRIQITIDPPKRKPPEALVLYLRHPEGAKIKEVSVDGKPTDRFEDGSVVLEGLTGPARVEVRYR